MIRTNAARTPLLATIALAAALGAGCAKSPDTIAALQLPAGTYGDRTCTQLRTEVATAKRDLAELSKKQRQAQAADTVGVLLVGVPVGSVGGADRETEIAGAKGRMEAAEGQLARKKCG